MWKRLRPFTRLLPAAQYALFVEWLFDYWRENAGKNKNPMPNPWAGWRRGGRCSIYRPNGFQITTSNSVGQAHPWNNNANTCLYGQAAGAQVALGSPVPASDNQLNFVQKYGSPFEYLAHTDAFWRPVIHAEGQDFVKGWAQSPDPNFQRWAPGYGEPLQSVPDPYAPTYERQPVTDRQPVGSLTPEYQVAIQPQGLPSVPGHIRAPTRAGTKERKAVSKSRALVIFMFKLMDKFSEGAEIIDAVFDALPDDVKKQWEEKGGYKWKKIDGKWTWSRPNFGDSFGQYGIEGADYKIPALWHNFEKINPEEAVKNILKNHLSDKVIGEMQRRLPRNTGAAHQQGEMKFAKWLDSVLDQALEGM